MEALISSNSLALCFPCTVFKQLSKKVISGMKQNVFSTGLGAAILNQCNCAKFDSLTNLTTVVSKTAISFLIFLINIFIFSIQIYYNILNSNLNKVCR